MINELYMFNTVQMGDMFKTEEIMYSYNTLEENHGHLPEGGEDD